MSIKDKVIKLGKKFNHEKNKLLKTFKTKKKSDPLILADPEWIKKIKDNTVFQTIINKVTINKQKYEFWTVKPDNQLHFKKPPINSITWTVLNNTDNLKKFNKIGNLLKNRTFTEDSGLKNYYMSNPININNAITVELSKTTLEEIKSQLEKSET